MTAQTLLTAQVLVFQGSTNATLVEKAAASALIDRLKREGGCL
jgi:hypothetical protein